MAWLVVATLVTVWLAVATLVNHGYFGHPGQSELPWSTLVTLTALVNSRCPTESGQLSLSWPT